jgi:putative endonuclease
MHYLYIVECSDKSYYTGISWNVEKRVQEHNAGLSKATKGKLPVRVVYSEVHLDKFQAARREKEIKGWSRVKKEKLINSTKRRDGSSA